MEGQFAPRMWSIVLTIFLALAGLEYYSRPPGFDFALCFAPFLALAVLVENVYRWVRYADANSFQRELDWTPTTGWRLAVLPIASLVVLSAAIHPWPMTLRFLLSRSAFDHKVVEVQQSGLDQGPQRIGLYWVQRVEWKGNGVGFVTGASLIDPVGFEYDPTAPPGISGHMAGHWYATEW